VAKNGLQKTALLNSCGPKIGKTKIGKLETGPKRENDPKRENYLSMDQNVKII